VAPAGKLTTLSSPDPEAGNSLDNPTRIVPQVRDFKGLGREFTLSVPAYSVSVLEFDAK
jgi:alpha-N-arabinofuranosidase